MAGAPPRDRVVVAGGSLATRRNGDASLLSPAEQIDMATSEQFPVGVLVSMWVIYAHPSDHPDKFVVRRHVAMPTGIRAVIRAVHVYRVFDTLDQARARLHASHPGLTKIDRSVADDSVIVETWL